MVAIKSAVTTVLTTLITAATVINVGEARQHAALAITTDITAATVITVSKARQHVALAAEAHVFGRVQVVHAAVCLY